MNGPFGWCPGGCCCKKGGCAVCAEHILESDYLMQITIADSGTDWDGTYLLSGDEEGNCSWTLYLSSAGTCTYNGYPPDRMRLSLGGGGAIWQIFLRIGYRDFANDWVTRQTFTAEGPAPLECLKIQDQSLTLSSETAGVSCSLAGATVTVSIVPK